MNKLILLLLAGIVSVSSTPPPKKCNPNLTIHNVISPNNPWNIGVLWVRITNYTDGTSQTYDYPSFPFYPTVNTGELLVEYALDGTHSGCISVFEGMPCRGHKFIQTDTVAINVLAYTCDKQYYVEIVPGAYEENPDYICLCGN